MANYNYLKDYKLIISFQMSEMETMTEEMEELYDEESLLRDPVNIRRPSTTGG